MIGAIVLRQMGPSFAIVFRSLATWMPGASLILVSACVGNEITKPKWETAEHEFRMVVEVAPSDTGERERDRMPAALKLDFLSEPFSSLLEPGTRVDLDSLQVFRFDPKSGSLFEEDEAWQYSRSPGERPSRFLDQTLPWLFPLANGPDEKDPRTFPRGALLTNAFLGEGARGLLTWEHEQDGNASSYYVIYFDSRERESEVILPRQGFVGDGSPRRAAQTDALTGTLYNRVAMTDWEGDGDSDLLIGGGFGNILLFKNNSSRGQFPKFGPGQYLVEASGKILDIGGMASPEVADWNGDGIEDLVIGVESLQSVLWYENINTNEDRKFVFRDYLRADGEEIIVPAKPNPESPHYKKDYAPAVEVVDWEEDGDLDLFLGGYITGRIWFYENIGKQDDGLPRLTFRGALEADGRPIDTVWGAHPCLADLDNDRDLDLLTGSFGQRRGGGDEFSEFLIYFENVGTRQRPRFERRDIEYEGTPPVDILAQARTADFNQDGLTDLVVSTYRKIYVLSNVGRRGSPKWKVELQPASWGLAPLSATQFLDWNDDGLFDVVHSPLDTSGTPSIQLRESDDVEGLFGERFEILPEGQVITHPAPYGDEWVYTYLYDIEADGDLDILWADGPGYAYLHRNRGSQDKPEFDLDGEQLLTVSGDPVKVGPEVVPIDEIEDFTEMQGSRAGIAAADYDEDGDSDIVMGDTYGDVYVYLNSSSDQEPLFEEPIHLGQIGSRAKPLSVDWDRDGDLDIVVVAWSGQVAWFSNLGPEGFSEAQSIELPPTVIYSPRILLADWNQDGDQDILVMSSYPWFCWLEQSFIQHGYAQAELRAVEER